MRMIMSKPVSANSLFERLNPIGFISENKDYAYPKIQDSGLSDE